MPLGGLAVEELEVGLAAQDGEQAADEGGVAGLVERDAEMVVVDVAQVDAGLAGGHEEVVGAVRDVEREGVEEGVAHELDPGAAQACAEDGGQAVGAGGDAGQAFGPVPDREHAGDVGEQDLGRADVGGGLLAADVLLAGLERHAQRGLAAGVDRDADDPAGHGALVGVLGGEEGGVRAAIADGDAEALGRAEGDVGTQLAGRGQEGEGQEVGGDGGEAAFGLDGADGGAEVADAAVGGGVLEDGAEDVLGLDLVERVADDEVDAQVVLHGCG